MGIDDRGNSKGNIPIRGCLRDSLKDANFTVYTDKSDMMRMINETKLVSTIFRKSVSENVLGFQHTITTKDYEKYDIPPDKWRDTNIFNIGSDITEKMSLMYSDFILDRQWIVGEPLAIFDSVKCKLVYGKLLFRNLKVSLSNLSDHASINETFEHCVNFGGETIIKCDKMDNYRFVPFINTTLFTKSILEAAYDKEVERDGTISHKQQILSGCIIDNFYYFINNRVAGNDVKSPPEELVYTTSPTSYSTLIERLRIMLDKDIYVYNNNTDLLLLKLSI